MSVLPGSSPSFLSSGCTQKAPAPASRHLAQWHSVLRRYLCYTGAVDGGNSLEKWMRGSTPPSRIHSPGTQSHSRRGRKRLTPNRCIRRQIVIVGCSHEIEVTVARGAARWRERKCSDSKLHGGFTYSIRGLGERWMSHIASAAY